MIVVPVCFIALGLFMRRSTFGIAIRAAAERGDRAAMLGIPVRRLQTIVWMIASVLAFLAMFLRAGAVGLPIGQVARPELPDPGPRRGGDRPHGAASRRSRSRRSGSGSSTRR